MKLEITESKKNELLGRTEMVGTIMFDGATPRRSEVKKAVAAAAKCKEDLLVVKKIDSRYGGKSATVTAFSYSNKDLFEKVEREYMRTRNAKVEAKKEVTPTEAPAAEAKDAAPTESEKKEDAPEKQEGKPEVDPVEKKEIVPEKEEVTPEAPKEEKKEETPKEETKPEEKAEEEAKPEEKKEGE